MATATRTAPYKNYEKYSPYAVHLRRRSIGANLDSDGNVRIYRAPDSSLTAAKNVGLVIEQADTTNNPTALVIKNSGTGVGIDLTDSTGSDGVIKLPASAITSAGTLSQQFPVRVGSTTFYLYGYTTGS
jgi:type 1 fimbria pilin|tara:strand:+ start:17 stop:403 length:387 start_codon:yes stop_codon:yes gene_type:complete